MTSTTNLPRRERPKKRHGSRIAAVRALNASLPRTSSPRLQATRAKSERIAPKNVVAAAEVATAANELTSPSFAQYYAS